MYKHTGATGRDLADVQGQAGMTAGGSYCPTRLPSLASLLLGHGVSPDTVEASNVHVEQMGGPVGYISMSTQLSHSPADEHGDPDAEQDTSQESRISIQRLLN